MYAKLKTIALLSFIALKLISCHDLTVIPSDPTDMDMPNRSLIVMRYSSYAFPGRPVHSVLSFIHHAQDYLLFKVTQQHGGWDSRIPGNCFLYQDENDILFAILGLPPNMMVYRFVKDFLEGLEMWVSRWSESPMNAPGTDIAAVYNNTSIFAIARLLYARRPPREIAGARGVNVTE